MVQSRMRAHVRNEHIQFTVEKKENGCLPFLDSLLTRESNGSISTSVYRKKMHTDQYLQFSSHHPLAKKSVITTLFHRATALSSDMVQRVQGLHKDLCRTVWAHPCNETERTPESGPQWRRERLGYCRACLEQASPHGLVSSRGGGHGTAPVPQIAVGVMAHSQLEPHE